jgi:hypothetical protein
LSRTVRCPDCGHEVTVSTELYHGSERRPPLGPVVRIAVHRPRGAGAACPGSGRAVDCVHCGAEHDFAGELCAACGRPPFAEVASPAEGPMTVEGKGGRPKGDRRKWPTNLYVNEEEEAKIRAAAEACGEGVAEMLKRLALEVYEERVAGGGNAAGDQRPKSKSPRR